MLKVNAYILAADPTWIELSVNAYYPLIQRLVVSYDSRAIGYTGKPIAVEECLRKLRALDSERKIIWAPGCFYQAGSDPMLNETAQRNSALPLASEGVDWVLQLDTDEWLPHPEVFLDAIARADAMGLQGVEWPMRVLFRKLSDGAFLEVCSPKGGDHFEYIAPVAVRAGTRVIQGRRAPVRFLRAVVHGDQSSQQLAEPAREGEVRCECLNPESAIVHNSWARSPGEMRRKLASWSHSCLRAWVYYGLQWMPSPWTWRSLRNFHPFYASLWPALRRCTAPLPGGPTLKTASQTRNTTGFSA
ncbi:MAG: hypothetical protein RLZZ399_563 [Verrucomicrobiota bacterium]|jgi:hypothetical protein